MSFLSSDVLVFLDSNVDDVVCDSALKLVQVQLGTSK